MSRREEEFFVVEETGDTLPDKLQGEVFRRTLSEAGLPSWWSHETTATGIGHWKRIRATDRRHRVLTIAHGGDSPLRRVDRMEALSLA